jgi:hypothetical protein
MTEPIDDCHAISIDITDRIRRTVMLLKDRAARVRGHGWIQKEGS